MPHAPVRLAHDLDILMSRLLVSGFAGESHRGAAGLKIHQLFLTPPTP